MFLTRHAQILIRDRVCWLQDLGSLNGTVYKKKKIVHQALETNEEFFIGDYRFIWRRALTRSPRRRKRRWTSSGACFTSD
jgi:pSer/pThr/pTyr-binding forkhead associated (FHA) protein